CLGRRRAPRAGAGPPRGRGRRAGRGRARRGGVVAVPHRARSLPLDGVGTRRRADLVGPANPRAAGHPRAAAGAAATDADLPEVGSLYDGIARESNGLLERIGPPGSFDGITLVDGGYASWDRRGGYTDDGYIDVWDLITTTAEARQSLL